MIALEQAADQLIAHYAQAPQTPPPVELTPFLTEEMVAYLKKRVDAQKLRNAATALTTAHTAQAIANTIDSPSATAMALWATGNATYHLAHHQQALTCYHQAQTLYAQINNPLFVACMQVNQVAVLQEMGQFRQALSLAEKAQTNLEAIGAEGLPYQAVLAMNRGAAYRKVGQLPLALESYKKGRAIHYKLNNQVGMARMDINRANVLQEMDDFNEAERLLLRAYATLNSANYPQEAARAQVNLGRLAYRRGQYQPALQHLSNAFDYFAALPNPAEVANINLHRSTVYRDLHLLSETLALSAAAEQTFKRVKMQTERISALINQGIAYQKYGNFASAQAFLARARRLLVKQGAPERVLMLDLERAEVALSNQRPDTAQRIAKRVQNQLALELWPNLSARLQLLLARCALAKVKPRLNYAQAQAQNALSIGQKHQLSEICAESHYQLAKIALQANDLALAWENIKQAIEILEQARIWLALDEFYLGFMVDKLKIYQLAVQISQKLNALPLLAYCLNLSASAPLSQLKGDLMLSASVASQLKIYREAWHWIQSKLERPDNFYAAYLDAPEEDILRQKLQQLESQIAELLRHSQIQADNGDDVSLYVSFRAVNEQLAGQFVSQIQANLQANQALVHYYVLKGQFQLLFISQQKIHHFEDLAESKLVSRILSSWQFHLSHGLNQIASQDGVGQAQAHLARFYQLLVAPLENYLNEIEHLCLVLPPEWHTLPLAAFFDGERYLVERFYLTYLSAPTALQHGPSQPNWHDQPTALIMGHSDEGRLPHNLREAETVARLLQAQYQTRPFLEAEATDEQFRLHSRDSHIIHVAGHALFRPDNPRFSWVRLANQRLSVADLSLIDLPQRPLVILSACETGRGQARGGGLMGMGRGFLSAGASGLVVSQWPIEDEASADLMSDFYTHLAPKFNAVAVAEALAMAQQRAIKAQAHPFFWAGLIFIGG